MLVVFLKCRVPLVKLKTNLFQNALNNLPTEYGDKAFFFSFCPLAIPNAYTARNHTVNTYIVPEKNYYGAYIYFRARLCSMYT